MRAGLVGVVVALMAAGCSPDIGGGTYFCGTERLCPEEQVCDETSFTCVNDSARVPFECPEGSDANEPNEDTAAAKDLGPMACGQSVLGGWNGCLPDGNDVDVFSFQHDGSCATADPRFDVTLRYPFALAEVQVELLDSSGAVIGTGENCTPAVDFSGKEAMCISVPAAAGTFYVRVTTSGQVTCSGDCHYNQYTLDIHLPLS